MQGIIIPILLLIAHLSFGQTAIPTYENVEARFVSIPDKVHAYHPGAEEYPTYEIVPLEKVWYPERNHYDWFGNVDLQDSFAIFFTGQLIIPEEGWYALRLNSDDGSILWLDDKLVLDNDGNHPMRLKQDTSYLKEQAYDFKIWYFQDYPHRMGIEFDVLALNALEKEAPVIEAPPKPAQERIVLDAQVLFAVDSYRLSKQGRSLIDSIGRVLAGVDARSFLVEGHTDDSGTDAYNQRLSLKRANAVKKRIVLQNMPKSKIQTKAFGSTVPVADNSTEEGRQKNRRVEIKIIYQ